jgi:hypothetical protein
MENDGHENGAVNPKTTILVNAVTVRVICTVFLCGHADRLT